MLLHQDEDDVCEDASDAVSSQGKFSSQYLTKTTKMLAGILAKFLGPNLTRDALVWRLRLIKKLDPAFHEWNVLHGYGMIEKHVGLGPVDSLK